MDTRRLMIEEMLAGSSMENLVRDAYANYVVQTALEYADIETKDRMIESIRPVLPSLKNTPHGRRIASKIMSAEGIGRSGSISTIATATSETASPVPFNVSRQGSVNSGRRHIGIYGNNIFQNNTTSRYMSPTYSDNSNLDSAFTSLSLSNQNGRSSNFGINNPSSGFSPTPNHSGQAAGQSAFSSYTGAQGHTYF